MHLYVSAYNNPPVILRKTMKERKRGVTVNNRTEVNHEEKYEDNELMK